MLISPPHQCQLAGSSLEVVGWKVEVAAPPLHSLAGPAYVDLK
jgi:hypothetical protein